jgi:hypothetical protein
MNLKTATFFIACLVISFNSFTQELTPKITYNSQYLYEDFIDGIVELNDSSIVKTKLNYNIVQEEMHYKDNNIIKALVNKNIIAIYFQNIKFIYTNSKYYEEVSYHNNLKLLLFRKPNFSEANKIGGAYNTTSETSTSKRFSQVELANGTGSQQVDLPENVKEIKVANQFYILDSNNNLFMPSKSKLIKYSNKDKELIKKFIKENKLKLKKKEDLIKLLDFI